MEVALRPRLIVAGPDRRPRRVLLACGIAITAAAAAVAAAIALTGARGDPGLVAVVRALVAGLPLAVGLSAWYRHEQTRFGVLLMLSGAVWFVTTLAESHDSGVYAVGRIAGWFAELLFVYLVLAFPTGRLTSAANRRIVGAMCAAVVVLYLPRIWLGRDAFEVPSPFTSCVHDCPANPFFAGGTEPGWLDGLLVPLSGIVVLGIMTATVVQLDRGRAAASPHTRPALTPVLAVATAFVALLGVGVAIRPLDRTSPTIEAIAWMLAFTLPAISVAFLVGLLRWRLFAGRALEQLALCLRTMPDPPTLRSAFASAFDDPSVEIVFPPGRTGGSWTDSSGRETTLPEPSAARGMTAVMHDGRLVAALTHDRALEADPTLMTAGTAMAGVVLDNLRLAADADRALREMRRSRARLAKTAEEERRRIERDLHDGAQQRLVALRVELGLTEDLLADHPDQAAEQLHRLEHEVDQALDELRSLAHGVYPPLLAAGGLIAALQAAALRVRIPVHLETEHVGRYRPEIESAVYFCLLEALQNVLKHAGEARRIVIRLDGGQRQLRFSLRDDGDGAPGGAIHRGAGITNMTDRLAAVGGEVDVVSTPRVGTLVRGRVPTLRAEEIDPLDGPSTGGG